MYTKLWWIVGLVIAAPLTMLAAFMVLWSIPTREAEPVRVLSATTQILSPKIIDFPSWNFKFDIADGRGLIVTNYLKRYNSPLLPHAEEIVSISDKYGLDWRLLVAIAQQESNLCKKIPKDSYNCWGYGIYGDLVTRFDSYPDGLDTVARGLKRNYLDRGLKTPEEIMAKYTPPSQGSWARGVNQFLEDIQ